MVEIAALSKTFRHFGEVECRGSSALYERLSISIAEDDRMLALAARCPPGQPAPNLLFAAAHYLLLQARSFPLARFYRSLNDDPLPPDEAYPAFQEFCFQNSPDIERLLTTRYVQTNEVRRSTYLFLAFSLISRLVKDRPLALIEIGASAGLNLLCDKYGYRFGDFGNYGDRQSPLQLECSLRGDRRPPFPGSSLNVIYRVGLDLNPVDVTDVEQVMWLFALVWSEHVERALTLRRAIEIARQNPLRLLRGNALDLLSTAVQAAPDEAVVCAFNTHALYQFTQNARDRLSALVRDLAATREHFFWLSAEELTPPNSTLELTCWHNGRADQRVLANCHPHGQWIEWLDDGD